MLQPTGLVHIGQPFEGLVIVERYSIEVREGLANEREAFNLDDSAG